MNINELMINDLVLQDDGSIIKLGIRDFVGIDCGQIKLHPVQVTHETLQKIGFYYKNNDYAYLLTKKHIVSMSFNMSLYVSELRTGREICHCIKENWSIHELQHALRLCGLNELSDSFKID